ncbi:MAG: FIST C-terminal domain-containing protein [Pseudomonadota bacterium]|nr:FIST C-terminal domain-containing protein [Pseudomonadota bacterium]
MQRFVMAHGSGRNWPAMRAGCLRQLSGGGGQANVGFLYVTSVLAPHLGEVLGDLRAATGVAHWIGTVGIGISCTGREYYETPALAVLLASLPDDAFRIIPGLRAGLEGLAAHGDWYRRHRHHLAILHGDPRNPATPRLIEGLAREVPGAFCVGGLSSSASDLCTQIADTLTEGGVSGLLLAPQVMVTTGLTQGCSPLGPRHRITACQFNSIYRLDDRPAVDVLFEDIGEILSRDPRRIAGYIFAGLPVAETDTGDYLVRNLLRLDLRSRHIEIGEYVTAGQSLLFCRRDGNSARDDLLRMLRDVRRRLPAPPRGGLYVSCLGRGRHLFGEDSQELRLVRAELGDVPLVGFFANGEISHNRLYGYTGVLTLFS